MNRSVERSIQLYKVTQHPLRCLSDRDPCNLRKSAVRMEKSQPIEDTSSEEKD